MTSLLTLIAAAESVWAVGSLTTLGTIDYFTGSELRTFLQLLRSGFRILITVERGRS